MTSAGRPPNLAGPVEGPTRGGVSETSFDRDVGWRIDYQIAPLEFAPSRNVEVDLARYAERWSDHAPRRHLQGLVRFVQDQRHQTTAQSRNAGDHAPSHHRLEHRRPWHAWLTSTIGNTPPSLVEL